MGRNTGHFQATYAAYKLQYIFCICNIFVARICIYRFLDSYFLQAYYKINLLHINSTIFWDTRLENFSVPSQWKFFTRYALNLETTFFRVLLVLVRSVRGNIWLLRGGSGIQVPFNLYLILRFFSFWGIIMQITRLFLGFCG